MINVPNFNEINHVVAYLRRVPYDIAQGVACDCSIPSAEG